MKTGLFVAGLFMTGLAFAFGVANAAPLGGGGITPGSLQGGSTAQEIPRVKDYPTASQLRHNQLRIELAVLQREAFALQQQDGGNLTREHRLQLQAKLDRINARWR